MRRVALRCRVADWVGTEFSRTRPLSRARRHVDAHLMDRWRRLWRLWRRCRDTALSAAAAAALMDAAQLGRRPAKDRYGRRRAQSLCGASVARSVFLRLIPATSGARLGLDSARACKSAPLSSAVTGRGSTRAARCASAAAAAVAAAVGASERNDPSAELGPLSRRCGLI